MRDAGLAPACMIEGGGSVHYSVVINSFSVGRIIAEIDGPRAFYCRNDLMVPGVLGECREKGISVPGRVAIIGADERILRIMHNSQARYYAEIGIFLL